MSDSTDQTSNQFPPPLANKRVCTTCRGAGMLIEIGPAKNTTRPCPDCKKAFCHAPGFDIIKGVPVPLDVKTLGGVTKPMTYPWAEMDIGDLWECEFTDMTRRHHILNSLRYYEKKHDNKFEFAYRLTREKGETKRQDKTGIEIWRIK